MATTPSSASPFPTSPDATGTGSSSMSNGTSTAQAAASAHDATQRVAQTAHETVDRLASKAGPAIDKIRTQLDSVSEMLHGRAGQFGEMQEEWVEEARAQVRAKPLQAVGIALAVGWLIGRLTAN